MFLNIYNLAAIYYDKEQRLSMLLFLNGERLTSKRKPTVLLNHFCNCHGSTLQGRIASAQTVLGIKQKSPVMVCLAMNCCFFPTQSFKNENCIWIQARMVTTIVSINSTQTKVMFGEENWIEVEGGIRSIRKQIDRCKRYYLKITMPIDKRTFDEIIGI